MSDDVANFLTRLRGKLGVPSAAPLVFVGNFEVERHWGEGEPGLPTFNSPDSDLVVNRMDEFAMTLAGPDDVVVLKEAPDEGYLDYLTSLGWSRPRIVTPTTSDPRLDVTADALAAPELLRELGTLRDRGAVIVPHGVSSREESLAQASGLPLAGPPSAVCKAVNSKVYSRRLAEDLGLRQPAGRWCDGLDTWQEAVAWGAGVVGRGGRVAVKDAFGVSGKGILQIATHARLDRLDRMFASRADRLGHGRLAVVVEEWVDKSADLNYQFSLGRDGSVRMDFVKEALTENGVHKGHLMPARLSADIHAQLADTCRALGAALAADGYFGVVGVDAMLDPDGGLYPVTEINARHNMSTYQESMLELVGMSGRTALARHYPIASSRPVPFAELRTALGDTLLTGKSDSGLLVNNFATCGAGRSGSGAGRLYGILVGPDMETVAALDGRVTDALTHWQESDAA
jgi:phosphoribosylaminoimidazole carboxylase (NCAIR synthetase)